MTFAMPQFFRWPVAVERYGGAGAYGEVFAAAVTYLAWIDDERKLVRDADGAEVVAETRVFLPLEVADVSPGSKVTLPSEFGGRTSIVLATSRFNSGGLGSLDHLELALK